MPVRRGVEHFNKLINVFQKTNDYFPFSNYFFTELKSLYICNFNVYNPDNNSPFKVAMKVLF